MNLIFIVYNNKKNKEIPRDNADMSNEKAETASPKAYGIRKLRSLSKSISNKRIKKRRKLHIGAILDY